MDDERKVREGGNPLDNPRAVRMRKSWCKRKGHVWVLGWQIREEPGKAPLKINKCARCKRMEFEGGLEAIRKRWPEICLLTTRFRLKDGSLVRPRPDGELVPVVVKDERKNWLAEIVGARAGR